MKYQWIVTTNGQSHQLLVSGNWTRTQQRPYADTCIDDKPQKNLPVTFDATQLTDWDSTFVVFIQQLLHLLTESGVKVKQEGLPQGVVQLLKLSATKPANVPLVIQKKSFFQHLGQQMLSMGSEVHRSVTFLGEMSVATARVVSGRSDMRWKDFFVVFSEVGPKALAIVSLISLLVGVILAFVGAIQLRLFNAEIYIADLVGLGMAREMGAMMTAIIMAGRTGSAFAAQLGTMQVNEEIDAIKTMGMNPMDYLVMPRLLALIISVPLLTLYADFMGILGGMLIGTMMMDIPTYSYYTQTLAALSIMDFTVGLFKASVFGVLIALAGCMRGIESGRSASAVGNAATSAVVTAIVSIVVADAILTVLYDRLGI